jgi:hypothetical protein
MNKKMLHDFVFQKINEYPSFKEGILELYYLVLDEIEEGGSEAHECNLCISSINDLIAG